MPSRSDRHTPAFDLDITERGGMVRYHGAITRDGIADAARALGGHAGFRADLPTVWDFSSVQSDSELTADDMRRLGSELAPLREGGGSPRVAVVTSGDAGFGGARMFGGVNKGRLLVDLRVFRDAAEAIAWAFAEPSSNEAGASGGGGS